ncbi:hypothetical protein LJC54_07410, partial [Parabacteroides sp. OttesenSCG-928-J18]|nr:hypothetical protein [Parabacteroides sp. OttesenSCG-928-J18]
LSQIHAILIVFSAVKNNYHPKYSIGDEHGQDCLTLKRFTLLINEWISLGMKQKKRGCHLFY